MLILLSFITFVLMRAGSDAILLGAETLRGLYPVETVSTVSRICAEVISVCMRNKVFKPKL